MHFFASVVLMLSSLSVIMTAFAAWVTHVLVCIKSASWILLIVGIFVPPIGWVHGGGYWFGWF